LLEGKNFDKIAFDEINNSWETFNPFWEKKSSKNGCASLS